MQHDASRVVQAVLQYGTPEQRLEVVKELASADVAGSGKKGSCTNSLAELCKVQYAHFAVLKIIKYCYKEKECVKIVVKVRKHFVFIANVMWCYGNRGDSYRCLYFAGTKA